MDGNSRIQQVISSFAAFKPPQPVWIHEAIVACLILKVKHLSPFELISETVTSLHKGYIATQRKKSNIFQGQVDLTQPNNSLSITMQYYGIKEPMSIAGSIKYNTERNRHPRWFFFWPLPTRSISVEQQLNITRTIMGLPVDKNSSDVTAWNWYGWYENKAVQSRQLKPVLDDGCSSYLINQDIIRLGLYNSNKLPFKHTRTNTTSLPFNYPSPLQSIQVTSPPTSQINSCWLNNNENESAISTFPSSTNTVSSLPSFLLLTSSQTVSLEELSQIEVALSRMSSSKSTSSPSLILMPSSSSITQMEEITTIIRQSPARLRRSAVDNVKTARDGLTMNQIFKPREN